MILLKVAFGYKGYVYIYRHTCTSLITEAGVALGIIVKISGHADNIVTNNIALFVRSKFTDEVINKFQNYIKDNIR